MAFVHRKVWPPWKEGNRVGRARIRSVDFIAGLRWMIPLIFGLLGISYVLIEQVRLHGHTLTTPLVLVGVLFWGLVGPVMVWLTLTWVVKAVEAQQELAFRNRELAALNAIGEAASRSLDLDIILGTALGKMVDLIGSQAGQIRLLEGGKLTLKSHYGVSPDSVLCEWPIQVGHCLCGMCAKSGKILSIDDVATDPSLADSPCCKEGFLSIASIPLKIGDQVIGITHFASRQRHAFSSRDLQTLITVGARVATSARKARLYAEAQRRAMYMQSISLIGRRMTSLLDLDLLMAEAVRLIRKSFGYFCHILLVDEATNEVVLRAASGQAKLLQEQRLRLKIGREGITGWVAHTGQALLCNDVSREPRYHPTELLPEARAELAVPMRVGKRVIGVLDVQSDQLDAFDREDVTVLQILGNQVGAAIENARLFQETRHRYEAMVALHETSLDLIAQLGMKELLDALLRRGVQLLGAQAGCLFLYDAAQELIHNAANYNTARDWSGVTLRPGEGVIGQVILKNEPLIVNDYENWRERAQVFVGVPHTIVMGAPLRWQDEVIGGIIILNDRQAGPFDSDDLWLLSLFADLASIAVKNAELHTQVKEFSQGLELEVEKRTQALFRAKGEIVAQAEQLRELLAKTTRLQEEERSRIARDMHDGVVQLITAARYELRAARVAAEAGSAAVAHDRLKAARGVLDEIEQEIRHAIYDLAPPGLSATGLVPALRKHASSFQELSGVTSHVHVAGTPFRLQPATERDVFRLVEEALNNVATHARAETVCVILDFQAATLRVVVQDDGRGFDCGQWMKEPRGGHLGLLGMQERVANLGGEMEMSSRPRHGTRVTFRLPIQREEAQAV